MLLDHPTHRKGKPRGESSMSGKPGCREAAKRHARRGPDGTVKAAWPESPGPSCKASRSDTAVGIRRLPKPIEAETRWASTLGGGVVCNDRKGPNGTPKPSCTSATRGTRDSLPGASLKGTETP